MSTIVAATSLLTLGAVTTTAVLGVILSLAFATLAVIAAVSLVMFTCQIGIFSTHNGKLDKKQLGHQSLEQRERVKRVLDIDVASYMRKEDVQRLEQRSESIRLRRQQEMQQQVDNRLRDAETAKQELDVEQGLRGLESFPTMESLAPYRTDALSSALQTPPPRPAENREPDVKEVRNASKLSAGPHVGPLGLVRVNGRIISSSSLNKARSAENETVSTSGSWETESNETEELQLSSPFMQQLQSTRSLKKRRGLRSGSGANSSLRYAVGSPRSKIATVPR